MWLRYVEVKVGWDHMVWRKATKIFLIAVAGFFAVAGVCYYLADSRQCIWKRIPNQTISVEPNARCYQNPKTGVCVLIKTDSSVGINSYGVIRRDGWHIVNLSFAVVGETAILYSVNDDFESLRADREWITPVSFSEKAEKSGYTYTVDEITADKKHSNIHLSFWTAFRMPEK